MKKQLWEWRAPKSSHVLLLKIVPRDLATWIRTVWLASTWLRSEAQEEPGRTVA